jgi:hypothetical protein
MSEQMTKGFREALDRLTSIKSGINGREDAVEKNVGKWVLF